MKDLMGMMKQAQQLQARMQQVQDDLGAAEVEGRSGGGLVAGESLENRQPAPLRISPR